MNIVSFYLEFNVFDKRLKQQKHNFTWMFRDSWKKQARLAIYLNNKNWSLLRDVNIWGFFLDKGSRQVTACFW